MRTSTPECIITENLVLEFNSQYGKLFFNSVFSGGAYTFLLNLSKQHPVIIINPCVDYNSVSSFALQYLFKGEKQEVTIDNLDFIFKQLELTEININHLIYVRSIDLCIDFILEMKHKYNLEINIYLHDFYSVCPSVNLLNYKKEFCNLPSDSLCNGCLEKYDNPVNTLSFNKAEVLRVATLHKSNIVVWRGMWRKLFDQASKFILPSDAAAKLWKKAFPEYANDVTILQHDLSYLSTICRHENAVMLPFYQVYVIGDIGEHKGSVIVHEILELIKLNKLNICINVIGDYVDSEFQNTPYLKLHGRFNHDDIANVLNAKEINCFLMPSICPETFSYVTQEMMATGLPIITFNLGGQAQFISGYIHGSVVQSVNSILMFNELEHLFNEHRNNYYSMLQFNLPINEHEELSKFVRIYELLVLENEEMYIHRKREILNYERLILQLEQVLESQKQIQQELLGVYQSQSWKITKPLRELMLLLKKFRK